MALRRRSKKKKKKKPTGAAHTCRTRDYLVQSFRTMVRLSGDRTGPQGFDHLIEKNYGSGLCQLEVDSLFAAIGDLAKFKLALRRKSKIKKKKKKKKPTGAACAGRTCDPAYSNPSAK